MNGHEYKTEEREKALKALAMMKELEKNKLSKMKRATIDTHGGGKITMMVTDIRTAKQYAKQINGDLTI